MLSETMRVTRHRRMLCQATNTAWSGSTKYQDSGLTDQQLVRVVLFDAMKLSDLTGRGHARLPLMQSGFNPNQPRLYCDKKGGYF